MRREVGLVDHEQAALGDAGPPLRGIFSPAATSITSIVRSLSSASGNFSSMRSTASRLIDASSRIADRGVRAAAGFHAHDALGRQRAGDGQQPLVFLRVDVVDDARAPGDVVQCSHGAIMTTAQQLAPPHGAARLEPRRNGPSWVALRAQIGNSVGLILSKDVLARLKPEKGETVFVTDAANGVMLTPYDPSLDQQLEIGR
jgi:hypothetical protein